MDETREKVLTRLKELIDEARSLKNGVKDHEDPRVDAWKMQAERLLDRLGGQKMLHDFRTSISFSCSFIAGPAERLETVMKKLESGKNYLVAVKDDLEMFDEADENALKEIKRKLDAGGSFEIV